MPHRFLFRTTAVGAELAFPTWRQRSVDLCEGTLPSPVECQNILVDAVTSRVSAVLLAYGGFVCVWLTSKSYTRAALPKDCT